MPVRPPRLFSATGHIPALCLMATLGLAASLAPAQAGWIDDTLLASNVCEPSFPGVEYLLTGPGQQDLLGRPARDWTQADLDALPAALRACDRASAAQGGVRDLSGFLNGFVAVVHQAWAERDAQRAIEQAKARQAAATVGGSGSTSPAGSGWISDYLLANAVCQPDSPTLSGIVSNLAPDNLLGRPAETWTQADLDALPAAFRTCKQAVATLGGNTDLSVYQDAFETIVHRAWMQRDARVAVEQAKARQAAALAAEQRAADQARLAALPNTAAPLPSPAPLPGPVTVQVPALASPTSPAAVAETEPAVAAPALPTFPFSADALQARFDRQLRQDGDSRLARCSVIASTERCTFDDATFLRSVAAFEKLGLVEGPFDLTLSLVIAEQAGHATRVTLLGERADPMNLGAFTGAVSTLLKTMEPDLADDELTGLMKDELSLMRGDSDPTIGQERTVERTGYTVACLSRPSVVSMAVRCTLEPRS